MNANRTRTALLGILLCVIHLAGCAGISLGQTGAPPTPLDNAGGTATSHAINLATIDAVETRQAVATATPKPVVTPVSDAGLVTIALPDTIPYLQDGGALPPDALARIGIGDIGSLDLFPDNQQVMLGTSTGLYVYKLPTFERVWRRYLPGAAWGMDLSPDGQHIEASYGWNSHPLLYDAVTGDRVNGLPGWHQGYWSPDGRYVAVESVPAGDYDTVETGTIVIYEVSTGNVIRELTAPIESYFGEVFSVAVWSPDSTHLAACSDTAVDVWDVSNGTLLSSIPASTAMALYLRNCGIGFGPDGRYLILRDGDHTIVIDPLTGTTLKEITDGAGFDASYGRFYLAEDDHVSVFDTTDWSLVTTIDSPASYVTVSPSGKFLGLHQPGLFTVVETQRFAAKVMIPTPDDYAVEWSPAETVILLIGIQKYSPVSFTLFDASTGSQLTKESKYLGGIRFLDEQHLLIKDNNRLYVVDRATGHTVNAVQTNIDALKIAWSKDSQSLVIAGEDGQWTWSAGTGTVSEGALPAADLDPFVEVLKRVWRRSGALSTSPDGKWHAVAKNESACGDGPDGGGCGIWGSHFEILWGDQTVPTFSYDYPSSGVVTMAWTADSRLLAEGFSGTVGGLASQQIIVFEPATGAEMFHFEGHLDGIGALIFSPDGQYLASASDDGTIIIWAAPH